LEEKARPSSFSLAAAAVDWLKEGDAFGEEGFAVI
jgi:hypothetical protein